MNYTVKEGTHIRQKNGERGNKRKMLNYCGSKSSQVITRRKAEVCLTQSAIVLYYMMHTLSDLKRTDQITSLVETLFDYQIASPAIHPFYHTLSVKWCVIYRLINTEKHIQAPNADQLTTLD